MLKNGIPEDHIILMSFDDVANDSENPFPGQLFNKPNGPDVYKGCKADYKGNDVTPANFLNIIKGDAAAMKGIGNGKVLKSTKDSRVFINFADHGAPGLIAFPAGGYLYADKLNDAINYMHDNTMYSQMVLYIEACESGSMFPNLKPDINVYAVTAANADESSWGTYCSPDDVVNGKHINSCLGDLFSVNWMENDDVSDKSKETLQQQFDTVKKETDKSHVMNFGTKTFMNEVIGEFEGNVNIEYFTQLFLQAKTDSKKKMHHNPKRHVSAINARDAKLHHLYSKVQNSAENHKASLDLQSEITNRMRVDHVFEQFAQTHSVKATQSTATVTKYDCLRFLMNTFEAHCGKFDDYSLKYIKHIVNACESHADYASDAIAHSIKGICSH